MKDTVKEVLYDWAFSESSFKVFASWMINIVLILSIAGVFIALCTAFVLLMIYKHWIIGIAVFMIPIYMLSVIKAACNRADKRSVYE